MKNGILLTLLVAFSPAIKAQSLTYKQLISWDLFFGYEQVFDINDFNGDGEKKSGAVGIVGSWGFNLKKDWYMRFELGCGASNEYAEKRIETLVGSDLYAMDVKATTLILGVSFTKFIPLYNDKFYFMADLGQSVYLSKLKGEVNPYRQGLVNEESNGNRFQSDLGFNPGIAFRTGEGLLLSVNYGFIGLRAYSTDLKFSNYQLSNNTGYAALTTDFSATSIRLRFTYFFK